jgi:hypothetical protein
LQALQWALLKRLGGGLGPDSLLRVPDLLLADLSQQPPSLAVLHQLRALAANAGGHQAVVSVCLHIAQ